MRPPHEVSPADAGSHVALTRISVIEDHRRRPTKRNESGRKLAEREGFPRREGRGPDFLCRPSCGARRYILRLASGSDAQARIRKGVPVGSPKTNISPLREEPMTRVLRLLPIVLFFSIVAAQHTQSAVGFLTVPELGYRLVPDFFVYPSPVQMVRRQSRAEFERPYSSVSACASTLAES